MGKYYYLLQLDFNSINHMIFKIQEEHESNSTEIGFIVLEDCRRAGTLDDFSYLKPAYEDGEIWDDERNLIVVSVYTYEEINEDQQEGLLELASTLVEFKPNVNHRVDFFVSNELLELTGKDWDKGVYHISALKYLLSNNVENKLDISNLSEDDFNHLFQKTDN
ncbi:hypothetical protein [Terrisporobacter mayombei]|uniref:DUF4265 domain-containing protein n=1 Tax=Terrisporobacter mayombei TaxID=1541 RepID=A0ABY9PYU1_9FIRM|nr:hypothetical protein [Terrisporobacter mayombei]MCC3866587.1 hypothetical protein [Terrisporobacter mayombei]WMT80822.1 hypothetical protein TEMA_11440 [Terrisporobacter mayombei]